MENWPLFAERYAPEVIAEAPKYQELLITILLATLAIGAMLWSIEQRNDKKKLRNRYTLLDLYLILQSILLLGLIYAENLIYTAPITPYWTATATGILLATGYLLFNTLLYSFTWYAFGTDREAKLWFNRFVKLWGRAGIALYIPLIISIAIKSQLATLLTLGAVYIAFRILILTLSISIFPKLLKYPLHIILYLCTCEVAPVLFLLV